MEKLRILNSIRDQRTKKCRKTREKLKVGRSPISSNI